MQKITSVLLILSCLFIGFSSANAQQLSPWGIESKTLPDANYLQTGKLFGFGAPLRQNGKKAVNFELSVSQKQMLTRIFDIYKIHLKAVKSEINDQPANAEKYIMSSLKAIHKLMQEYPNIKKNNRFKELYRTVYTEYSSFYGIARTRFRERGKVFAVKREFLSKNNWMKGEYVLPKSITKTKTTVPLVTNEYVKNHIAFFTQNHRNIMDSWLKRAKKYFPMMKRIFKKVGVPTELIHLSMIESGLNPFARSSAAAVGMWQFIAPTARGYGLKINFWVDERRDPIKETYAAARYLRDLYNEWGNWYLAMANYNCSTVGINSAIRDAGGVENYWKARPYLPRETQGYVPGFIATTLIARNAKKFGFKTNFHVRPYSYIKVKVAPLMSLKKLAKAAGITTKKLKKYNPELLQWATPPGSKYTLKLPIGSRRRFIANYRKIPKNKRSNGVIIHTVHSGETLGYIAGKFGTTVHALLGTNKGLTSLIYPGQKIIVPLGPGSPDNSGITQAIASDGSSSGSTPSQNGKAKVVYTVKSGDTIGAIAELYNVSASQIRDWNNTSNLINIGDRLAIYVPKGRKDYYQSVTSKYAGSSSGGAVNYVVHSNDTLIAIAHRFGTSVSAIKKGNSLSGSRIYVGQHLTIHAKTIDYVVRPHDTLSEIANNFGVSVQDIQQLNGLRGSRIYQGQHLRISVIN